MVVEQSGVPREYRRGEYSLEWTHFWPAMREISGGGQIPTVHSGIPTVPSAKGYRIPMVHGAKRHRFYTAQETSLQVRTATVHPARDTAKVSRQQAGSAPQAAAQPARDSRVTCGNYRTGQPASHHPCTHPTDGILPGARGPAPVAQLPISGCRMLEAGVACSKRHERHERGDRAEMAVST